VVARGAGKTGLVTALLEWMLWEGTDLEVCCVATQQDKANIIHGRIQKMHRGEDRWRFVGGGGATSIGLIEHKKATLKAMPCTDNAMDGITPRLVIADEAARMDAAILRAMSSVTKTRTGQMLFITTPDRDQKTRELWPYWEACEIALDQDEALPEGWWALLWGMDPTDEPDSDLAVHHANPSAGVLISVRDIRTKIQNALKTADPKAREETWLQELATFTDDLAGALPLELLDRILPKLKACGHRVLIFSQMVRRRAELARPRARAPARSHEARTALARAHSPCR
jgi:phage terminase large subunit-like protein